MRKSIPFFVLVCFISWTNASAQQIKTLEIKVDYGESGAITWDEIFSAPNETIRKVLIDVTLTESVNDKITGTFDLQFSDDRNSASGSWIGSKGQKLFVSLKKQ